MVQLDSNVQPAYLCLTLQNLVILHNTLIKAQSMHQETKPITQVLQSRNHRRAVSLMRNQNVQPKQTSPFACRTMRQSNVIQETLGSLRKFKEMLLAMGHVSGAVPGLPVFETGQIIADPKGQAREMKKVIKERRKSPEQQTSMQSLKGWEVEEGQQTIPTLRDSRDGKETGSRMEPYASLTSELEEKEKKGDQSRVKTSKRTEKFVKKRADDSTPFDQYNQQEDIHIRKDQYRQSQSRIQQINDYDSKSSNKSFIVVKQMTPSVKKEQSKLKSFSSEIKVDSSEPETQVNNSQDGDNYPPNDGLGQANSKSKATLSRPVSNQRFRPDSSKSSSKNPKQSTAKIARKTQQSPTKKQLVGFQLDPDFPLEQMNYFIQNLQKEFEGNEGSQFQTLSTHRIDEIEKRQKPEEHRVLDQSKSDIKNTVTTVQGHGRTKSDEKTIRSHRDLKTKDLGSKVSEAKVKIGTLQKPKWFVSTHKRSEFQRNTDRNHMSQSQISFYKSTRIADSSSGQLAVDTHNSYGIRQKYEYPHEGSSTDSLPALIKQSETPSLLPTDQREQSIQSQNTYLQNKSKHFQRRKAQTVSRLKERLSSSSEYEYRNLSNQAVDISVYHDNYQGLYQLRGNKLKSVETTKGFRRVGRGQNGPNKSATDLQDNIHVISKADRQQASNEQDLTMKVAGSQFSIQKGQAPIKRIKAKILPHKVRIQSNEFYINMDLVKQDQFMTTEEWPKMKASDSGWLSSARRTNQLNNDIGEFEDQQAGIQQFCSMYQ